MVICFFVLLLWFTEFVNFFDMHKMDWIVQKWPTIPIYMSKFYIIKCCQAFLGVISSFRSHCLYAYSYFCGLKHSEPGCFLSQLTKINFWVPVQRYESPILLMLMLYNYQWFSTKICSVKSHEKIWWYIKKFIINKMKSKVYVSFLICL